MTPCEKCGERDATIFLTQVVDGNTTKMSLCEKCGEALTDGAITPERLLEYLEGGRPFASLANQAFERVASGHPEYSRDAFLFVLDGVDHALRSISRSSRHVSARELLEALRSLAIGRYGSAARDQLGSWGITRCEDFGEIVFAFIDSGVLGKRPEDRKEDFQDGFDFAMAFARATP